MKFLFRVGFRVAIICSILLFLVSCFYYYLASNYDMEKVAEAGESSLILAEDGSELSTLNKEVGTIIEFDQLPSHLVDALLTREDTRFRKHMGIDIKGLLRATLKNITSLSYKEGASTSLITSTVFTLVADVMVLKMQLRHTLVFLLASSHSASQHSS